MQDGTVRCWGHNDRGQLGGSSRLGPIPGLSNVISISAGVLHTCALTGEGAVYCWGENSSEQFGTPSGWQESSLAFVLTKAPSAP